MSRDDMVAAAKHWVTDGKAGCGSAWCALRLIRTPRTADTEQSVRRDPYSADG
jgi:hypothetical protein